MSEDWDTDWTMISFEPKTKEAGGAIKASPVPQKGVCPKCGKRIGKGIAFHVKACEGKA